MKKILIIFLIGIYLLPQNLQAQDNESAVAAGVGALVAIGVGIAAVEQMKEQVELEATQYILSKFPENNRFLLKTLDFDGKKVKDMSSVSVITFKLCEFDIKGDGKSNYTPKNTSLGKRMVLFAFTSHGWINQYGVDFDKIQWHLISDDEWLNMMTSYTKLASGENNDVKIKKVLKEGKIVNTGVRAKKAKDDIDFYKKLNLIDNSNFDIIDNNAIFEKYDDLLRSTQINDINYYLSNDILVKDNREYKKLAGILIELQGDMDGQSAAIIGVGINLNLSKKQIAKIDQPAIGIAQCNDEEINPNEFLGIIIKDLAEVLAKFESNSFEFFRNEWQSYDAFQDQAISLSLGDGLMISGRAKGVNNNGALEVITEDDGIKTFSSGEVTIRKID